VVVGLQAQASRQRPGWWAKLPFRVARPADLAGRIEPELVHLLLLCMVFAPGAADLIARGPDPPRQLGHGALAAVVPSGPCAPPLRRSEVAERPPGIKAGRWELTNFEIGATWAAGLPGHRHPCRWAWAGLVVCLEQVTAAAAGEHTAGPAANAHLQAIGNLRDPWQRPRSYQSFQGPGQPWRCSQQLGPLWLPLEGVQPGSAVLWRPGHASTRHAMGLWAASKVVLMTPLLRSNAMPRWQQALHPYRPRRLTNEQPLNAPGDRRARHRAFERSWRVARECCLPGWSPPRCPWAQLARAVPLSLL